MRANDLATTAAMPLYFSAVTACSRELPLPQFRPATITSPACASRAKFGSRSSSACAAISFGAFSVYVYLPGKMTSVLTPSPYFQTLLMSFSPQRREERKGYLTSLSLLASFAPSRLDFPRVGNNACNRRRRHHSRTRQIN